MTNNAPEMNAKALTAEPGSISGAEGSMRAKATAVKPIIINAIALILFKKFSLLFQITRTAAAVKP